MRLLKRLFLSALFAAFCYTATAAETIQQFSLPATLLSVSNATVKDFTAAPIAIPGGNRDITIWQISVAADAGTSNVVYQYNLSAGNTNYTTTSPISLTNALNGTNPVVTRTVINRTNLSGVGFIRPDGVSTTQTNAVTSQIFISVDP